MRYSKELHDYWRSQSKADFPETPSLGVVFYLLDEIERLQEERRWIPVSESLPPPAQKADGYMSDSSELVHVYPPPRNDRGVCYLHYLGKWSCSAEVNVTHWMSLPEPPEEEK